MRWWRGLLVCVACTGGGGGGGGGKDGVPSVECDVECPDGTRRAGFDAVVRGEGFEVVGAECGAVCEGIVACGPPNVPSVDANGDYECAPLEGYVSSIGPDTEVDFGWADLWVQP